MGDEKNIAAEMVAFMNEKMGGQYTQKVIEYGIFFLDFGALVDPDGHAKITGPCGDTDELFLRIKEGRIEEAKFITDGCICAIAACQAATHMATGKTIHECLQITESAILEHLGGLPLDHTHCALLASMTLQRALCEYIVQKK